MMQKLGSFVTSHIQYWAKAWFGLIFLGSIFNELSKQSIYLASLSNISFWSYVAGAAIGLMATYRGKWL
ncbi:hypothetical protein OAC45_00115 [Gammaproteobacteria bacterium]|jgi:cbb3-type cytochrome oxidase subunit 1|nr:hypothetical protein [Gammaproteobacteria bacterium]